MLLSAYWVCGPDTNLTNEDYWVVTPIPALMLAIWLTEIFFYFWTLRGSKTPKIDADMDRALQCQKGLADGVVMCLPQHWHDAVAYRAERPVLFGGHGYGFRRLEPLFPIIRQPVNEIVKKYDVRYLLTYNGHLSERSRGELRAESCMEFGAYRLYCLASQCPCIAQFRPPCPRIFA